MGISVLDGTIHSLTSRGLSPATSASYRSGVRRYLSFCVSYGLPPFPLSELVLCRFVAFLVLQNLSYGSIRLYLSALRHKQLLDSGIDPALGAFHRLHYVLRGCHRSLPSSVRPKRLPITPTILRLLHHCWATHSPTHLHDTACLWAACCTAFFGFLRSGEFTCNSWDAHNANPGLSLQDISIDSRSRPSVVHVTLRHSKTDVFGVGVTIHLGRTGDVLCPVSALLAYMAIRPPTPGPLFLLQSGKPLSRTVLVSAVRQTLLSMGVDVSGYNGHSFRVGAATAAAQAGLSDSAIQQLGRWKSAAFTRYLRPPAAQVAEASRRLLLSNHNNQQ